MYHIIYMHVEVILHKNYTYIFCHEKGLKDNISVSII